MKKIIFGILFSIAFIVPAAAIEYANNTFLFNIIFGKIGWAFGLWGSNMDKGSTSGGIMCGANIGGSYNFTPTLRAYAEIGYNYYGLARNSNYPEYPLGYGSGKTYASVGVSLQFAKEQL
ncbi:MAG: hypothetical protein FWG29_01975 [Treponema sp.]|nr:hypothetical protein [Treponema sp.]